MVGILSVLTFAILVAALIVAFELSCRLWLRYGSKVYVWPPKTQFGFRMDPKVFPRLSTEIRFTANRAGARGPELHETGRGYRIVACGGSSTECVALDDKEAWPAVVENILTTPANRCNWQADWIECQNIGKSGMTTEGLIYLLPRVLPRFARS